SPLSRSAISRATSRASAGSSGRKRLARNGIVCCGATAKVQIARYARAASAPARSAQSASSSLGLRVTLLPLTALELPDRVADQEPCIRTPRRQALAIRRVGPCADTTPVAEADHSHAGTGSWGKQIVMQLRAHRLVCCRGRLAVGELLGPEGHADQQE